MKTNKYTRADVISDLCNIRPDLGQKAITDVVSHTIAALGNALGNGMTVELRGFGVLRVGRVKARVGRNPNKPEVGIPIPARSVIRFRPGKILKAKLAKL